MRIIAIIRIDFPAPKKGISKNVAIEGAITEPIVLKVKILPMSLLVFSVFEEFILQASGKVNPEIIAGGKIISIEEITGIISILKYWFSAKAFKGKSIISGSFWSKIKPKSDNSVIRIIARKIAIRGFFIFEDFFL